MKSVFTFIIAAAMLATAPDVAAGERADAPPPEGTILDGLFMGGEVHASLLTGVAGRSLLNPTLGGAIRAGYRWGGWGLFLSVEQNAWIETELDDDVVAGALNVGIGGEVFYADDFVFTRFVLGPSVLLFDTTLDEAGEVGVYVDLRPLGLRFTPISDDDAFAILFEPLTMAIVAPVLGGIPLVQVEYRTLLGVEYQL